MKTAKLVVATAIGTFTRSTARTYTHLVVIKGYRAERLEASRLAQIAYDRKLAREYRKGRNGQGQPTSSSQDDLNTWADQYEAGAAKLEARGPITRDAQTWGLTDANLDSEPSWGVAGWCGRLDLARKLASKERESYRDVRVIDVATGQEVR